MNENKEKIDQEKLAKLIRASAQALSDILDEQPENTALIWSLIDQFCNNKNQSREPNETLNEVFGGNTGDFIIICIMHPEQIDQFIGEVEFKHKKWLKVLSFTFTESYTETKRFQNNPRSLKSILDYDEGTSVDFNRADDVSVNFSLDVGSCIFVIRRMLNIIEAQVIRDLEEHSDQIIALDELLKIGLEFVDSYNSQLGDQDGD